MAASQKERKKLRVDLKGFLGVVLQWGEFLMENVEKVRLAGAIVDFLCALGCSRTDVNEISALIPHHMKVKETSEDEQINGEHLTLFRVLQARPN